MSRETALQIIEFQSTPDYLNRENAGGGWGYSCKTAGFNPLPII